jgi:phosphatidylglycerol:prolipoprotein diacylglycerol transferase
MPNLPLAAIEIPFDPNISGGSSFALSWHGFLSFIAVAVAVWLVSRAARNEPTITSDMVYNVAIWGIVGGIVGARTVHVADNWDIYGNNLTDVFAVWEGGIGLWGGILGGWLAGAGYAAIVGYPVGKLMDMTAAPMLVAQTVGRIGDIINGEHWSRATDLPWAWYFTHPDSPARTGAQRFLGDPEAPAHPAVVYEMIWNIVGMFVLYKLRHRLKPDGSLFMFYLGYYALGRFLVQFIRLDKVYFANLQEAHLIAIGVMLISVTFLVWKARFKTPEEIAQGPTDGDDSNTPSAPGRRRRDRAERRARAKASQS